MTTLSLYQIPTRVELHIGAPAAHTQDPEACTWRRLGAIGFADNEQSRYCARELKSIGQLDEESVLLKLVILGAHQNALNRFHQVTPRQCQSWLRARSLAMLLSPHGTDMYRKY